MHFCASVSDISPLQTRWCRSFSRLSFSKEPGRGSWGCSQRFLTSLGHQVPTGSSGRSHSRNLRAHTTARMRPIWIKPVHARPVGICYVAMLLCLPRGTNIVFGHLRRYVTGRESRIRQNSMRRIKVELGGWKYRSCVILLQGWSYRHRTGNSSTGGARRLGCSRRRSDRLRLCNRQQPPARNQTGYEITRCQGYHRAIGLG